MDDRDTILGLDRYRLFLAENGTMIGVDEAVAPTELSWQHHHLDVRRLRRRALYAVRLRLVRRRRRPKDVRHLRLRVAIA